MNTQRYVTFIVAFLFFQAILYSQSYNLLVVTGGKKIDTTSFYSIFDNFSECKYEVETKPEVFSKFSSDEIKNYDVILFYDAYQPISELEKKSFLKLTEEGIGLVFLHHAMVSHQDWQEYENLLGGRYYHKSFILDGKKVGASTYKHDEKYTVQIINDKHPVTKGMRDFLIHDEIYINYKINNEVTPLLSSDNCESGKYIGWTKNYNNSKIVVIQLGHDKYAYENISFQKLILNSIKWTSLKR